MSMVLLRIILNNMHTYIGYGRHIDPHLPYNMKNGINN